MNIRMKLILTRPLDDSLEEFLRFRKNSKIRFTNCEPVVIIEEHINEWEKFWKQLNSRPQRKVCMSNYVN